MPTWESEQVSLSDFMKNGSGDGVLTAEALYKAFEVINHQPPDPCSLGRHVVSPDAWSRGGWATCANCYRPVKISDTSCPMS
jgi:hypothetical protein